MATNLTYYDKELGVVVVPEGACPYPIGDDDGTVAQCVERLHCGCCHAVRATEHNQFPELRT